MAWGKPKTSDANRADANGDGKGASRRGARAKMSPETQVTFQAAALLLSYPETELIDQLDLIEQAVADTTSAELFAPTIEHLRWGQLRELQEFHVQEFDLSRRHALHLTYWTDGDTRRRGEVLAAIKQTYRDSGLVVTTGGELPDFLPMVLEFAARGDHERGLGILNGYRASLELLRLGLRGDKLPQEGVVEAVCRQLPGELAASRSEVQRLYGAEFLDQPPVEQVGMTTYQIEPMRA